MSEQDLQNLSPKSERGPENNGKSVPETFSRQMDEKGYTGAYERYHTIHADDFSGAASVKLSEERKREIRERVARTLAERLAEFGIPGGDSQSAAPEQAAPSASPAEEKTSAQIQEQEEIEAHEAMLQKELTRKLFEEEEPAEKISAENASADAAPAVSAAEEETASEPEETPAEEKDSIPAAEAEEEPSPAEPGNPSVRGIVTDDASEEGEPFSYTNFKLKRANAVKDFFSNMHEFTFTRTNQEAVEMLHMHPQKEERRQKASQNARPPAESKAKQEADFFRDRVENLYHVIGGEKQMAFLRTIVTGVLTLLSLLFLTIQGKGTELLFCGAALPPRMTAALQLLTLLLGCAASANVFVGTFHLIQNRRFGKEMLVSAIGLAGLLSGILCLCLPDLMREDFYASYTVFYLLMFCGYHLGMLLQMRRLEKQLDRASEKDSVLRYSLEPLENRFLLQNLDVRCQENPLVVKQVKGDILSGFENYGFAPDWFDQLTKPLLLALVLIALVSGFGSLAMSGSPLRAVDAFFGAFAFCGPFSVMFAAELPLVRACREQEELQKNIGQSFTVLHADAAEQMTDAGAVVVGSETLFPPDAVLLHGLRSASGVRVDEAILDAVSILTAGRSILAPTFLQMISGKTELLKEVDSITYEDGMGISAWVGNNRVLIGSRRLMENHNIRMPSAEIEQPENSKGRMVLYLARCGELITAFTLSLSVSKQVKHFLSQARGQGIKVYVKSVDFLIENNLEVLFGEDADVIRILPSRLHADYDKETNSASPALSMVLSDGSLFSALHALSQLKKLRASLELTRLLSIILFAVTGIYYLSAAIAGAPVLICAAAGFIPFLLHSGFFLLRR